MENKGYCLFDGLILAISALTVSMAVLVALAMSAGILPTLQSAYIRFTEDETIWTVEQLGEELALSRDNGKYDYIVARARQHGWMRAGTDAQLRQRDGYTAPETLSFSNVFSTQEKGDVVVAIFYLDDGTFEYRHQGESCAVSWNVQEHSVHLRDIQYANRDTIEELKYLGVQDLPDSPQELAEIYYVQGEALEHEPWAS